ncbi:hypothetical protein OsI_36098 [Oryza sativa Indica Group]|uniref:Uncharacterized protein n=1 Tax=Oryza sativa subsp. indica TaxID=39946 RepID=B8BKH3_ORYSI|nr:hypothetical protein OsI_36098 [Oryza sativa Indica Group]
MGKFSIEAFMQLGVSDEINWLKGTVSSIKKTLADADYSALKDDTVRSWSRKLKDVMYEAADILDVCDEMEGEEHGGRSRNSPVALCLPIQGHKIRRQVKALRQKADAILEEGKIFDLTHVRSDEDHNVDATTACHVPIPRTNVVGRVQETRMLVDKLTGKGISGPGMTGQNVEVIAIVGMGGIGKTTLAREIFTNDMIQGKFDKRLWITISKGNNSISLLQQVIQGLGCEHEGIRDSAVLEHIISSEVRRKKVFLVMDDVWEARGVVDIFKKSFVGNAQAGSRILITTRSKQVAQEMQAAIVHEVSKLSSEDSRSLFLQCFLYHSLIPKDHVISCDKVVHMWIAEGFVGADATSELPEVLGMKYYKELVARHLLEPVDEYDGQGHYKMDNLVHTFAKNVVESESLVVEEGEENPEPFDVEEGHIRRSWAAKEKIEWKAPKELHSLRTLIIIGNVIVQASTGRTLSSLSRLRTLHVNKNEHVHILLDSLHHMKHLRYLDLSYTDALALPNDIGEMKFLQYICLQGCKKLVKLPKSIVELHKLRYLNISETKIKSIPEEGFGGLKNMVSLHGFPSQMMESVIAKDWCSLGELKYMSQLMHLALEGLENCASGSMASLAKIDDKKNLASLRLSCTSRLSVNGEVDKETVEEVFDQLCPPPKLQELNIKGFFGARLPRWLIFTNLAELRVLKLDNLVCCNQLPSTLWQLPCLEYLYIKHTLNVKHIGHGFLLQSSIPGPRETDVAATTPTAATSATAATAATTTTTTIGGGSTHNRGPYHRLSGAGSVGSGEEGEIVAESATEDAATTTGSSNAIGFPKLKKLVMYGMMKWKEWEWEDQVEAMPKLENMHISWCLLNQLPPGLASQARSLRILVVDNVKNLISIDGFCSVVQLHVSSNFKLERISDLPKMESLTVSRCPKLNILQRLPALQSMELNDQEMERLPDCLRDLPAKLRHLRITCNLDLLTLISRGKGTPEWEKIKHIQQVNACTDAEDDKTDKRFVFYKRDSDSTETNIEPSPSTSQVGGN